MRAANYPSWSPSFVLSATISLSLACSSGGGDEEQPLPTTTMTTAPSTDGGLDTDGDASESESDSSGSESPEEASTSNEESDSGDTESTSDDGDDEESSEGGDEGPTDEPFVHSCENEIDDDADELVDCEDRGCFEHGSCSFSLSGEYLNYRVTGLSSEYAYAYSFGDDDTCAIQDTMGAELEDCTYDLTGDGSPDDPLLVQIFGADSEQIDAFFILIHGDGLWLHRSASAPWELFGKSTMYSGAVSGMPAEYLHMGSIEDVSDVWHRQTNYAAWEVRAAENDRLHVSVLDFRYAQAGQAALKLFGPLDAVEEEQVLNPASSDSPVGEQTFEITTAGRYLLLSSVASGSLYRLRVNRLDAEDNSLNYNLNRAPVGNVSGRPLVARAADLNGDDLMDLVVATGSSARSSTDERKVLVYLQQEGGTMATPVGYAFVGAEPSIVDATSLAMADFDGDGEMDVMVGHSAGLSVLYGEGEGVLGEFADVQFLEEEEEGGESESESESGGMEEEPEPEAAYVGVIVNTAGNVQLGVAAREEAIRLVSTGEKTFTRESSIALRPEEDMGIAVGDANGDGTNDFVITAGSKDRAAFYLVDGEAWTAGETKLDKSNFSIRALSVAMGDLTGDGKMEIAVGHSGVSSPRIVNSRIQVFRRLVSGRYELIDKLVGSTNDMHIVDLDGDGSGELVSINALENGVSVYRSREGGWLPSDFRVDSTASIGLESIAVGDFNGDGCNDIASAVNRGRVDLFSGEGCK